MPRARNIKPGFFKNEELAELPPLARILFQGLWCEADREGRLEDRPKRIKAEYLPYDDCDCDDLLQQLHDYGFIHRYVVGGRGFIQVVNFAKHQKPHQREAPSEIPGPGHDEAHPRQCLDTAKDMSSRADSPSLIADCLTTTAAGGGQQGEAKEQEGKNAYPLDFERAWQAYPKRHGGNPKPRALKAWRARMREGVEAEKLIRAVERYEVHMRSEGKLGTQYVMQAATFFGPDEHWKQDYPTGPPSEPGKPRRKSLAEQMEDT